MAPTLLLLALFLPRLSLQQGCPPTPTPGENPLVISACSSLESRISAALRTTNSVEFTADITFYPPGQTPSISTPTSVVTSVVSSSISASGPLVGDSGSGIGFPASDVPSNTASPSAAPTASGSTSNSASNSASSTTAPTASSSSPSSQGANAADGASVPTVSDQRGSKDLSVILPATIATVVPVFLIILLGLFFCLGRRRKSRDAEKTGLVDEGVGAGSAAYESSPQSSAHYHEKLPEMPAHGPLEIEHGAAAYPYSQPSGPSDTGAMDFGAIGIAHSTDDARQTPKHANSLSGIPEDYAAEGYGAGGYAASRDYPRTPPRGASPPTIPVASTTYPTAANGSPSVRGAAGGLSGGLSTEHVTDAEHTPRATGSNMIDPAQFVESGAGAGAGAAAFAAAVASLQKHKREEEEAAKNEQGPRSSLSAQPRPGESSRSQTQTFLMPDTAVAAGRASYSGSDYSERAPNTQQGIDQEPQSEGEQGYQSSTVDTEGDRFVTPMERLTPRSHSPFGPPSHEILQTQQSPFATDAALAAAGVQRTTPHDAEARRDISHGVGAYPSTTSESEGERDGATTPTQESANRGSSWFASNPLSSWFGSSPSGTPSSSLPASARQSQQHPHDADEADFADTESPRPRTREARGGMPHSPSRGGGRHTSWLAAPSPPASASHGRSTSDGSSMEPLPSSGTEPSAEGEAGEQPSREGMGSRASTHAQQVYQQFRARGGSGNGSYPHSRRQTPVPGDER